VSNLTNIKQFSLARLLFFVDYVNKSCYTYFRIKVSLKKEVYKMLNWLIEQEVWVQALIGTLFTWGMTALGAALVFPFKTIERNLFNLMLGFASGVMIAASFWSLLAPAIDMANDQGVVAWIVVAVGFGLGGIFLYLADKTVPHMHFGFNHDKEGIPTRLKRNILLIFSITLHNIPEGLAVGVAFGAIQYTTGDVVAATLGAIGLAIGIGIQNFPEGAAVSIPLRQEGMSRRRAFMWGQASGAVEPISAILGAILVTYVSVILPYALAFAAGAMIYVVVEELIPEAQQKQTPKGAHYATLGVMIGFIVMMVLDVALG
jgi:ZIP family zinc transporter